MKQFISMVAMLLMYTGCSRMQPKDRSTLRDGFYEVMIIAPPDSTLPVEPGKFNIAFDTLFNLGDRRQALIDTTDYVPLELETLPVLDQQSGEQKLLSVSLTPAAALKIKIFTSKRVMHSVAVVLNGKIITVHKIREAITGNGVQITRCSDNGCDYLYTRMKDNVKH